MTSERIKLSKTEKRVLKRLYDYGGKAIEDFYPRDVDRCVRSLQKHHLAKGAFVEGGLLEDARITEEGKAYIRNNPKLRNPTDWKFIITTGIALMAAVAAMLALFVACNRF